MQARTPAVPEERARYFKSVTEGIQKSRLLRLLRKYLHEVYQRLGGFLQTPS